MSRAEPARERPRKRGRLSPEAIVEAAIRLADADGLEAVSIRGVAAELDARAMSLYDHLAGKDELLAAMTDRVVGEMLIDEPLPEHWREAVATSARRMFATFAAHPWLISVFTKRPGPGPNSIELAKQLARAVATLDLEQNDVWNVQGIVNDYVVGYSFRIGASPDPADMEAAIAAGDVADFPELAALPDNIRSRALIERFELGLQTVLDGIERRFLDQRR